MESKQAKKPRPAGQSIQEYKELLNAATEIAKQDWIVYPPMSEKECMRHRIEIHLSNLITVHTRHEDCYFEL